MFLECFLPPPLASAAVNGATALSFRYGSAKGRNATPQTGGVRRVAEYGRSVGLIIGPQGWTLFTPLGSGYAHHSLTTYSSVEPGIKHTAARKHHDPASCIMNVTDDNNKFKLHEFGGGQGMASRYRSVGQP